MKKLIRLIPAIILLLALAACNDDTANTVVAEAQSNSTAEPTAYDTEAVYAEQTPNQMQAEDLKTPVPTAEAEEPNEDISAQTDAPQTEYEKEESRQMQMLINGTAVTVEWESNDSVETLRQFAEQEPITVQMSMYGGFEQVGSLGTALPRNDVQTTTQAGDIVLYAGNQIVVFYGSNSWAYTRLGHITDKTPSEMAELLGNGNVTVTISMEQTPSKGN